MNATQRPVAFDRVKVMPFDLEQSTRTTEHGRERLTIRGFGSLEVRDADNEGIRVGFFDEGLTRWMPSLRWMHERGDIQGKWTKVEPVPSRGYWFEGYLVNWGDAESGKRLAQVEEKAVASLSVGFNVQGDMRQAGSYDADGCWWWERNGLCLECSPVDVPACPGASFEVAKMLGLSLIDLPALNPPTEEERALADLERVRGGAEAVRNIATHWLKEGGALSPKFLEQVGSPILTLCEVVKAGEVLSAANVTDLEAAKSALDAVLERHRAARSRRDGAGDNGEGADDEDAHKAAFAEIVKVWKDRNLSAFERMAQTEGR